MRNITLLVLITLVINNTQLLGQEMTKKEKDHQAIMSMAGCYDVEFKYTETFAPEIDYEKAYDYTSAAFEHAEVIKNTEDTISLQHLLIIQKDSSESYIIKHWRQDWVYESDLEFSYDKDLKWVFSPLDSSQNKGKWTQSVYQVDDSPRYSGTATWTHVDGRSEWYHKADSPLPRREYSKRDDYNVMKRGNRVQITDYGWLHEQDNDKIIRTDSIADVLLAQEKGYNVYKRRPITDCQFATDWWTENHDMWTDMRAIWDDVYRSHDELQLHLKVEDKKLYEHLFFGKSDWTQEEMKELITKYVATNP